jgi:hypothetical protein
VFLKRRDTNRPKPNENQMEETVMEQRDGNRTETRQQTVYNKRMGIGQQERQT